MKKHIFRVGSKIKVRDGWQYRMSSRWDKAIIDSKLKVFTVENDVNDGLYGVHLKEISNLGFTASRFELYKQIKIKLYNHEGK